MKLRKTIPPFWRTGDSVRSMRIDILLAGALLLVLPVVRFGWRPLILTAATALTCVLTEMAVSLFMRREIAVTDLDSLALGVVIALLMPPNVPFYVAAFAAIFAVAVAKMPFGGTGHAPFPPAAAGVAFATLCFPTLMFTYCDPANGPLDLNIFKTPAFLPASSPAGLLKTGARPELLKPELLTGEMAGPIGATTVFLVAAAALYLFFRKTARWEITVSFMGAACLIAALFPRVATGRLDSVMIELSTGSLAFGAAFLITEPTAAPKLPLARCAYGFIGGALTMLLRYFGAYEQGVCFAVLLASAVSAPLDRLVWKTIGRGRGRLGQTENQ